LFTIHGLALLLPNVVVNRMTSLGNLCTLLVLVDELETGNGMG